MKGRLAVAIGRGARHIDPPGLTVVEPQLLLPLIRQQVEGAFDVLGRERLAVVPFDAIAQFEAQLFAVLAP